MKTHVTSELSLTKTICNMFGVELDEENFSTIFSQTLSYITKGITAFKYQKVLKPFCKGLGFSAKDFRLSLHESRYTILNLKLFMLRVGRHKSINLPLIKGIAEDLQVRVADAKRMIQVWEQHPGFRRRIKAEARRVPAHRLELLTLNGVSNYFGHVLYADVMRYIRFMTYKKLRFIVNSNNDEFTDYHNDVLAKVVQAFYFTMPVTDRTDLHVVNGLKTTVHNHIINIIKAETSQKKGRLVPVGFDARGNPINRLVVMAENQMPVTEGFEDSSFDEMHGGTGNNMDKFELEFSISEILGKLEQNSKKHRFLQILMGHEDTEFTAWLQNRKIASRNEDNVDVQMKTSTEEFNQMLGDFLHVEERKLAAFINSLRDQLALPKNMKRPSKIDA